MRMWAIVERELRKFLRSPALMLVATVFPLVQLVVLGQCLRRKDPRCEAWRGRPGPRHHGTQGPRSLRLRPGQRSHLRAGLLRQRPPGDGRRAQRQNRWRRHHSAAVFAPRLPAGAPAAGARRRQQRQLHELLARTEDGRTHRRAQRSRGRAAHAAEHRARNGRALSLHRVHEVPAARLDHAGDVRLGHDRRRHALHRRQGARHSRRLSGHADHAQPNSSSGSTSRALSRPLSPESSSPSSDRCSPEWAIPFVPTSSSASC